MNDPGFFAGSLFARAKGGGPYAMPMIARGEGGGAPDCPWCKKSMGNTVVRLADLAHSWVCGMLYKCASVLRTDNTARGDVLVADCCNCNRPSVIVLAADLPQGDLLNMFGCDDFSHDDGRYILAIPCRTEADAAFIRGRMDVALEERAAAEAVDRVDA